MSFSIDTAVLRALAVEAVPSELQSLRLEISDESITKQLLDAVEYGSVSPSVFSIWVGVCKSPYVIHHALSQKLSVHIRFSGIKQLKCGLGSSQWERLWKGLGCTAGLLEIFSNLSVVEVKAACKAIGRCTSDGELTGRDADLAYKQECVTELFKGLHPDQFPDAIVKSRDLRPLTKYYQILVPACTAAFVDWISSTKQEGKWIYVKERELLIQHSEVIGKSAFNAVLESQSLDVKSKDRLQKLARQFPPICSPNHEFSASMSFALSLLCRVVGSGAKDIEDQWVVDNLIRPLLRRAVRKRVAWSKTQQIIDLAVQFWEHHLGARRSLEHAKGDIVHLVALCWSRRSTLFETQLKRLLVIAFGNKTLLEDFGYLLTGVPRSRRYALLHMCCKEVMDLDIESETDLSQLRGVLSYDILYGLEASHALDLFQRLRRARGDTDLVSLGPYNSVLSTRRIPTAYEGDPDTNYLVLLNINGMHEEAETYAANMVNVRKKVTQTSASREARAENALSVWACANASGSLRLLRETLQWAKRFTRDQLTASRVFSTYYDETYRLLSGFLVHGNGSLESHHLRLRVEAANSIMTDMLDLACLSMREPFFRASDWSTAIESFTHIIKQRIDLSAKIQEEMMASDEDMYSALWKDTIAMLLRVEEVVNCGENEKLGAGTISGVVVWSLVFPQTTKSKPTPLGKSTWKFIDALAEARNELWSKLRPVRYPDVLTLPTSFPRGLPVQHLLANWNPSVLNLDQLAPYISSRVQATLFANPENTLEPVVGSKSLMMAIGCFVDSYNYALAMYVPHDCDEDSKLARLSKAWNHAIGPLSTQRMNVEEAIRFWKRMVPEYLQDTLSGILPVRNDVTWRPVIPTSEDPSQVQEWNPLEGRPTDVNIEARELTPPTYIDFCTIGRQAQKVCPVIGSFYEAPKPCVPAVHYSAPAIWSSCEASTLAALLLLDATYGTKNALLSVPFPSASDVRFPCVFLDEGFLSLEEVKPDDATSYITRNLAHVPLPLVHRITATIIKRLDTKGTPLKLEDAAFSLLRALADGDRPRLAFDLAIKVIMKRPDASSWHRILFNNGFLQRLSAIDAKACISVYAEAIGEKLDAMASNRKSRSEGGQEYATGADTTLSARADDAPYLAKPVIKVTTLKSLAQILHGSTYIGDDASLEILCNLSRKVKHIDVRVSILKTLLSKLDVSRPELWDTVLSALETFIPLAGSLNEREPESRASPLIESVGASVRKSIKSSETGFDPNISSIPDDSPDDTFGDSIPRIPTEAHQEMHASKKGLAGNNHNPIAVPVMQATTTYMWQNESPMLGALVACIVQLGGGKLWKAYMERIMLPLLDILMEQTAAWTTLFLKKYAPEDVNVSKAELPPIPKGIQILGEILSRPALKSDCIPRRILRQLSEYLMFRINPPAWIRTLNQRLDGDPSLKSLPEVEVWLALYGTDFNQSWSKPSNVLPFHRIEKFSRNNTEDNDLYVTRGAYRQAFNEVFQGLLWVDGPGHDQLSALVSTINVVGPDDDGRATIRDMIAYVNSLRTRDWERDPDRRPVILPDTFIWRLKLLAYPSHHESDSDESRESSSESLAQQLSTILDEISSSVYHNKLQQIKEQVKGRQNNVLTALYLGDISKTRLSWLTTSDLLRVDLAADMMLQSKGQDIGSLESRLNGRLDTWTASENEEVRRTGYKVRRALFDADGKWNNTASSCNILREYRFWGGA